MLFFVTCKDNANKMCCVANLSDPDCSVPIIVPRDLIIREGSLEEFFSQRVVRTAIALRVAINHNGFCGLIVIDATASWAFSSPLVIRVFEIVEFVEDVGVILAVCPASNHHGFLLPPLVKDLDVLENAGVEHHRFNHFY